MRPVGPGELYRRNGEEPDANIVKRFCQEMSIFVLYLYTSRYIYIYCAMILINYRIVIVVVIIH